MSCLMLILKTKSNASNVRKVVFHKTLSRLKHDPKTCSTSDLIFKILLFIIAALHSCIPNRRSYLVVPEMHKLKQIPKLEKKEKQDHVAALRTNVGQSKMIFRVQVS